MGSLTSRPKVLPVQQPEIISVTSAPSTPVTTTPVVTTTTGTTTTSSTTDTGSDTGSTTTDDTAAANRASNLQERSRGLLSTVLTGFDGVLDSSTTPQRKSLLGE